MHFTEIIFPFGSRLGLIIRGGDLRGLGAVPPKNVRWGTAHASVLPNILRSSVVGRAPKYEQSKKKGVIKELFSEIVVFLVRKGSYRLPQLTY